MRNNILSYIQMCQQESTSSLQKGMNFRFRGSHSILLMSLRKNAPYHDQVQDDGKTLIYEGHDVLKGEAINPKEIDQPEFLNSGKLSENGKFHRAVIDYKNGFKDPEKVRVYEKIKSGIWSDNGFFLLVDSWLERQGQRKVFKFKLEAIQSEDDSINDFDVTVESTRVIPTEIKLEVWRRDKGACTECGAQDELHFDHIIPFSRGGTSLKADNIQLLCARHNLSKSNKII